LERPSLSKPDRNPITVVSLVAPHRTNEPPGLSKRTLDNSATGKELVGLVTHLSFCAGWPAANSAVPILCKALDEADAPNSGQGMQE